MFAIKYDAHHSISTFRPIPTMKLSFRTLAILTAFICLGLALAWLLVPDAFLSSWGVGFSNPTGLVGRRGGALFAGLGVMFFVARNAAPSPARAAIVAGFMTACLGLAVLGLFEFATGHAGMGILPSVVVEVAFVAAFAATGLARSPKPGLKR